MYAKYPENIQQVMDAWLAILRPICRLGSDPEKVPQNRYSNSVICVFIDFRKGI